MLSCGFPAVSFNIAGYAWTQATQKLANGPQSTSGSAVGPFGRLGGDPGPGRDPDIGSLDRIAHTRGCQP